MWVEIHVKATDAEAEKINQAAFISLVKFISIYKLLFLCIFLYMTKRAGCIQCYNKFANLL